MLVNLKYFGHPFGKKQVRLFGLTENEHKHSGWKTDCIVPLSLKLIPEMSPVAEVSPMLHSSS